MPFRVLTAALWATTMLAAPLASATDLTPASSAELQRLLAVPAHTIFPKYSDMRPPRVAYDTLDRYWLWDEIALDTTAIDHTPPAAGQTYTFGQQFGPTRTSRAMAIIHIAMFEAVNAVTQQFQSYAGVAPVTGHVSLDWAIAQASHDTQVALYPSQKPRLDAIFAIDTALIHTSPAAKAAGIALGQQAAAAILAKRANDNSQIPEPLYGQAGFPWKYGPGYWSPDPVSNIQTALGAFWGQVTPFTMTSGSQFRPPPPPALTDPAYTAAFAAVKAIGGDPRNNTPSTRTPSQTFDGIFWTYDGVPNLCAPPRMYIQLVRTVALGQGMGDLSTTARFMALITTGMADAAIAAWDAKYYYQFWRPVNGIRSSNQLGNNQVVPDPNWYPLGGQATNTHGPNFTPNFPSYVSGHATFGGAIFELLRKFWPDKTAFTFVSDEYNGLNYNIYGQRQPFHPMSFPSFTAASYANSESRIYIGVHWQFDADEGVATGTQVGDWVYAHAFQPVTEQSRR